MIQTTVDTVFTALKSLEELAYPGAKILPNFSRSIQLDRYSCGAKCVYCILKYFGNDVSPKQIERLLRTDGDGTEKSDIGRVLKRFGLRCSVINNLAGIRRAIKQGSPGLFGILAKNQNLQLRGAGRLLSHHGGESNSIIKRHQETENPDQFG